MSIFAFTKLREDGRRVDDIRSVNARIGCVSGCSGSAEFSIGLTNVICQVYGPTQSRSSIDRADLDITVRYADFARVPHSDTDKLMRERTEEAFIRTALEAVVLRELYPSTKITVSVLILQDDGSAMSAAFNAASLALIDAGFPMSDFAVSLTSVLQFNEPFMDAKRSELQYHTTTLVIAAKPSTRQILAISLIGKATEEETTELIEKTIDGCVKLQGLIKERITGG